MLLYTTCRDGNGSIQKAAVCGTVECIKLTATVRLFAMTTLFLSFVAHTMLQKKIASW